MTDTIDILLQGLAHQRAGRPAEAEGAYRAVLAGQTEEPHALHCLGLLTLAEGRFDEAVAWLTRASAARPQDGGTRLALGRALLAAGRTGDAIAHLRGLSGSRPFCAPARAGLALALLKGGDCPGAIREADAALELDGSSADASFARGTALSRLRLPREAVDALAQTVRQAPGRAEAHLNLGNALLDLDRLAEAETHLRRAVALDPALAEAHASLGCLLTGDGRLDEAIGACDRAIALRPDFAQAHWNQSFALMLAGDFAPGWEKYEWRKRHDVFARHLMVLPGREWQGEALAGETVMVRAEQGLGDTIQFARYLPLLAARGAKVIVSCAAPLVRLLSPIGGVRVLPPGAPSPHYDFWIDQMSLPRLFGTRADTVPSASGYLAAEPARAALWDEKLPRGPRVGIVWAGNPDHSNDTRRSMPIDALAPLLAVRGCAFVSLQVGLRSWQISQHYGIADRSAALCDLAETAALVSVLDVVVSVDSCVAHLAGALGRAAWIMLPFAQDWRWMAGRTDSPWYESVRLFRQARAGDWSGPVAAVAAGLAALAAPVRPPAWSPRRPGPCGPASRSRPEGSPSPVPA